MNITSTSLPARISARAVAQPAAVAVEFAGQSLSYAELDSRSNRLARVLQAQGVGRDVLVGCLVERSLEMVVSLLGILKAGGAYVPLDFKQGSARIGQILADAQPRVLVGDPAGLESFFRTATHIAPSAALDLAINDTPPEADPNPSDLAYVIFTSGSTGRPKGVEIEHRSLLNLLDSMLAEPGFAATDTLLAVTTLAFDIAGLEIYLPLISGGRVVIAGSDVVSDGGRLAQLLRSSGATVMQATPATWRLIFASGWEGDRQLKVLVGGEALSPELARRLASSCGEVWNLYGPTETTIWSSLYRVTGKEERTVPIGRPIARTSLHILGENQRPCETGQEGELYIGGDGLARGYLGRADLTRERFVSDPFTTDATARLYRTGDVARRLPDGNVEFLGRTDHQVKISGYRIELGEIESVLERCPGVRQAVALAREDSGGEKYIAAYVLFDRGKAASFAQLRGQVGNQLPPYMAPAAFVQLPEFPLTANGKVDRKALPEPTSADFSAGQMYVPPRNDVEWRLAGIWEQVLGIRPIGVTTSFFDLGGRSIQAAQLFTRIGRTFGTDLPVSTLFRAATIERLAAELDPHSARQAYKTLIPIQPNGAKPPFFCVHGGLGSTLFLQSLAKRLGRDLPFYGLEPEGLDGKPFQRTTIEQMARHYIAEIRKVQPAGPYRIGGYCFGGIVAVEMARQLRQDGADVSLVALFSAPLRFNRLRPIGKPLSRSPQARLQRLMHAPGALVARRWRSWKSAAQLNICRGFLSIGWRVPQLLRTHYVDQMLRRAEWQYRPRFFAGALHLFRGRGLYDQDPCMGWDGVAAQLHQSVIGDSETYARREIMDEPLVAQLANEVSAVLERVEREASDAVKYRKKTSEEMFVCP